MSWYQNLHPSQTYAAECVPLLRQDLESPVWRFQMMSPAVVFCEMLVHLPPKRRNAELKGDICHRLPQDVAFWTFYAAEKLNFYRLQVLLRVCLGYAWSIRSMQWLPGSGLTRAESLHSSTQGHDPLQPFSTLGSCILQGKTARLGYFCEKLVRPQVPASEEPTNSDFFRFAKLPQHRNACCRPFSWITIEPRVVRCSCHCHPGNEHLTC